MGGFGDILNKLKTGIFGAGQSVNFQTPTSYGSYYQQTEPNLVDRVKTLVSGQPFQPTEPPPVARGAKTLNEVAQAAKQPVSNRGVIDGWDYSGIPEGQGYMPAPVASPQPRQVMGAATPGLSRQDLADRISRGLQGQVGNVPAVKLSDVFGEIGAEYPFFKDNPYLLPQISILETTGGKHVTYPNNYVNYGIRDANINNIFRNTTPDDVLRRTAREIGETGNVYKRFRTGAPLTEEQIADFINTYAPPHENNTQAYIQNLIKGMQYFQDLQ